MDCVDRQLTEEEVEGMPVAVKVAADRAMAEARKVSEERRAHHRVSGDALQSVNVARVKSAGEVSIVDLSRGGALLESEQPLRPGSRQSLELAGPERSIVVSVGVLRSRISALEPRGVIYRAACAFSRLLELPELAPADRTPRVEPLGPASSDASTSVISEPLMDTVLREVAAPRSTTTPGWRQTIARFADGRSLKGYTNDFDVSRPSFSLQPSTDGENDCVSVPLTGLKAVCFVSDFDEKAATRDGKTFVGQTLGRRVHLTFSDGEMVIGTTQGYRAGDVGLLVTPVDPRARDVRIFAVAGALRQIRFP
jgi:Family of unknown function (DUF6982)/PilZ domain